MAPEIINSQKTGYYTDMWSLICILYLCFTGHTPFSDKTEYLIFQNITKVKYSEKNIDLIPKEALDLITKFFKAEPSQRLGYKNEKEFDFNIIKNHSFFKLKDDNINLSEIKQQLMNKCSYYIKHLEKRNKNKNKKIKENEEKDSFSCDRNHLKNNNIMNDTNNTDMEENIDDYFKEEEDKGDGNNRIIKRGLLKKQSPYFYYDLRKVILYNTPRIDYIDPETNILKGSINLTKKCHSQLIKSNQFKLITPKRTYIFMCKERYDISPWVSAINKAIEKYSP
jgi:serine/threonine protein kinase